MIILDTNVLSELLLPRPEARVVAWQNTIPAETLFITTITEAELRYGVSVLPTGLRRNKLVFAISALLEEDFSGRILPFDSMAAVAYAEISASRRKLGHPISQFDAQIAAITRSCGAALATRNTDDFVDCGIEVVNPWHCG